MKDIVKKEMISAMKSKDKERLNVLRLITGKLNDATKENPNADLVSILDGMVKERVKSIKAYEDANRLDLVEQEKYEVSVINEFLPKRMSIDEIRDVAKTVISDLGVTSMQDMGKVMGALKGRLGNDAKPADIANVVKSELS